MSELLNKDWGYSKLHSKMLEILVYLDEFCKDNGIDYALAYGTALGAVRHNGFIPWDDDADIYMTLEGYRRFRAAFEANGDKERFYLQESDAVGDKLTFAKLRMNGTTYVEPLFKDCDMHHGIYVDIFILFNAPKSSIKRRLMNTANQYLQIKNLSNRGYKANGAYKMILGSLKVFPRNFGKKLAINTIYRYSNNADSNDYYDTDLRTLKRSFFPVNWVFPAAIHEFYGLDLPIPNQKESYLKQLYGEYMKLPSEESIAHGQHALIWDTEKDFHEYTNATYEYKDEKK